MISFRAGSDVKDGLEAAVSAEETSKSEIMRQSVAEWLRTRGYTRER